MNIFSWNEHSEGAKQLASEMDIKRIKHENSKYKGRPNKLVINWGSSQVPPEISKSRVLNKSEVVATCANKLRFFEALAGRDVSIPDWTNSYDVAVNWVAEGHVVCARTILTGHSAAGLVLMDKDNPKNFVRAPLYTKYIPKEDEYRVHVVAGKVIDIQRKALRNGWVEENGPDVNYKVRNLANGFVYVRQDVNPPEQVGQQALRAVEVLDLQFGAVDVIFNTKRKTAYVLEINTAPGLEGTTVKLYAAALKEYK
jgi:predicted ATP-grasp superfamily ATP-dependent carboligase